MSLFDGPDVVQAYPEVEGTDEDDNPVLKPSETPVEVHGRWQPVSSSELLAAGTPAVTAVRFLCRTWPTGAFGKVVHEGRTWAVDGEPQHSRGSEATAHWTVLLKVWEPPATP